MSTFFFAQTEDKNRLKNGFVYVLCFSELLFLPTSNGDPALFAVGGIYESGLRTQGVPMEISYGLPIDF